MWGLIKGSLEDGYRPAYSCGCTAFVRRFTATLYFHPEITPFDHPKFGCKQRAQPPLYMNFLLGYNMKNALHAKF